MKSRKVFQQPFGIHMDTNCALLLADLFLYSYEADFIQKLLQDKNKRLASSFKHTYMYRYIDDVSSINNHNFYNYVHFDIFRWTRIKGHHRIWYISFIWIFNLILTPMADWQHLLCNRQIFFSIYGVYIFQLIRYARACFAYANFSKRGQLLIKKFMLQGNNECRLV
jgi:hypothetical protein